MLAIHAIADIVAEETLEGSRISLANEDGTFERFPLIGKAA